MKQQLLIGLAAVGVIILLVVLYKVFLAEPPMPTAITKEEEMKHKGISAAQYSETYAKQYSGQQPGGQGGQGRGYGQGYGGGRPGMGSSGGYGGR
jgi:uncharacterized membrane protein YgcG